MKLRKEILAMISESKTLQGRIADIFKVSFWTVLRMIEANDDRLTTASVLAMLVEETGIQQEDLLEKVTA